MVGGNCPHDLIGKRSGSTIATGQAIRIAGIRVPDDVDVIAIVDRHSGPVSEQARALGGFVRDKGLAIGLGDAHTDSVDIAIGIKELGRLDDVSVVVIVVELAVTRIGAPIGVRYAGGAAGHQAAAGTLLGLKDLVA